MAKYLVDVRVETDTLQEVRTRFVTASNDWEARRKAEKLMASNPNAIDVNIQSVFRVK